jgi:hypothetical protein
MAFNVLPMFDRAMKRKRIQDQHAALLPGPGWNDLLCGRDGSLDSEYPWKKHRMEEEQVRRWREGEALEEEEEEEDDDSIKELGEQGRTKKKTHAFSLFSHDWKREAQRVEIERQVAVMIEKDPTHPDLALLDRLYVTVDDESRYSIFETQEVNTRVVSVVANRIARDVDVMAAEKQLVLPIVNASLEVEIETIEDDEEEDEGKKKKKHGKEKKTNEKKKRKDHDEENEKEEEEEAKEKRNSFVSIARKQWDTCVQKLSVSFLRYGLALVRFVESDITDFCPRVLDISEYRLFMYSYQDAIRWRIYNRFTSRREYNVFVLVEDQPSFRTGMLESLYSHLCQPFIRHFQLD